MGHNHTDWRKTMIDNNKYRITEGRTVLWHKRREKEMLLKYTRKGKKTIV